jgi:hypothetical protein
MTRYDLLREIREMEEHNLSCYSNGWHDEPKNGYETECEKARERLNLIKEMLEEMPSENGHDAHQRIFRGHISGYTAYGRNIQQIAISIPLGRYADNDKRIFSIDLEVADEWFGDNNRYDKEKDDRWGDDRLMIFKVDRYDKIVSMEWKNKTPNEIIAE